MFSFVFINIPGCIRGYNVINNNNNENENKNLDNK